MQHQGTMFQPQQVFTRASKRFVADAFSRHLAIGLLLVVALLAFELFNFDTTQYALANLLGDVSFLSIRWATILAFAFCAIDFAGLAHLFTPERGRAEPRESWYLMGAWLLGATMNALMTWWAINLTLLEHQFGNEVLSREQLLDFVPIFVAVLVWVTRILFIGAFSVAGDHLFRAPTLALPREAAERVGRSTEGLTARLGGRPTRPTRPGMGRENPRVAETPTLVQPRPASVDDTPVRPPLGSPRPSRPSPMPAGLHAAPRRRP
jgi:hypothetical protein